MSLVERNCHDSETALSLVCADPIPWSHARQLRSPGKALPTAVLLPSGLSAAGGLSADGVLSACGHLLWCAGRLRHSGSGAELQRLCSGSAIVATRRTSGPSTTAGRNSAPKLVAAFDPTWDGAWAVPESDSRLEKVVPAFGSCPFFLLQHENELAPSNLSRQFLLGVR